MLSGDEAVRLAREALEAEPSVRGRALKVHRLDRAGETYHLVMLGEPGATVGLAAIDADGTIMASARLPGAGEHLSVDGDEAIHLAGAGEGAQTRLVWTPSRQSFSPLYPIWELQEGDQTIYVDQRGTVSMQLDRDGRGGGVMTRADRG